MIIKLILIVFVVSTDRLKVPVREFTKPIRMCISDVFKGVGSNISGTSLKGRLDTGYVQNGDKLLLMPHGEGITVKGRV